MVIKVIYTEKGEKREKRIRKNIHIFLLHFQRFPELPFSLAGITRGKREERVSAVK